MIHIDDLSIRLGAFALTGLSLQVGQGEYAVLMGRTGSGKTTLLEAIAGLKPIQQGAIRLLGDDVTRLRPAERGVGYVPQDLALFPTTDRARTPGLCPHGAALARGGDRRSRGRDERAPGPGPPAGARCRQV